MAFRFHRRITIAPGVRLNLSKGGASVSMGPRGASVTVGKRGTYANLGLPGTGLSYRRRVDALARSSPQNRPTKPPGQSVRGLIAQVWRVFTGKGPEMAQVPAQANSVAVPPPPVPRAKLEVEEYTRREPLRHSGPLRDPRQLLWDRERGEPLWRQWADEKIEEVDPDEDPDAFERNARLLALQRFARRMVEGDRAAWAEVLHTELANEELPFEVSFDFAIEVDTDRIHLAVEVPPEWMATSAAASTKASVMKLRETHEDICAGLLLRMAHEVYRVIPEADELVLTGFRLWPDPATGQISRAIYLKCATDRENFQQLNLDGVDPSTAFGHLGGASKKVRGALIPLGYEPVIG